MTRRRAAPPRASSGEGADAPESGAAELGPRPIVAIVGRPNVGKSTLFNRLARRRRAIVEDVPGVTRDRHFADAELGGRHCTVVDTGGFVAEGGPGADALAADVRAQALVAIEECQVVLFVVDGRAGGPTADDEAVARLLRKAGRPVVLVVNKVDDLRRADETSAEFFRLGLGEPVPVSAEHGLGIGLLEERVLARIPAPRGGVGEGELGRGPSGAGAERAVRVAVVGRPNVGKSTLVNALLGMPRVIVSPVAGTTRDPIDTPLRFAGRPIVLTDTAGIRRKSTIAHRVEGFSVLGAVRAIEDCDVAVLVLDATEPAVEQDLRIAALALDRGRALVIVVNKWDLARAERTEADFRSGLKWELDWLAWVPVLFVTAKTGHKVDKVLEVALELFEQQQAKAPTPLLNKLLAHVTSEHPLPVVDGRPLKLYYVAQVGTAPPAFAFVCNRPRGVPARYERYVSNCLREALRLKVPLRIFWRERPGEAKRAEAVRRFRARAKRR